MEILRALLIVVEAVCSLLIVGLILLQKSKSEGLGMAFGAGMGETLFGSRAGNVLTRLTIIIGAVFMVNTVVLAMLYSGRQASLVEKSLGAEAAAMPGPATGPAPGATQETPALPPEGGATGEAPVEVSMPPASTPPPPAETPAPAPETPPTPPTPPAD